MPTRFQNSRVAILPWGLLFEDFLDPIGVSLDTFCATMTGSWIFGYVKAFEAAGIETIIIIVSADVCAPIRVVTHRAAATLCVLPAGDSSDDPSALAQVSSKFFTTPSSLK